MAAKDLGFDQGCYERALSELRYADSTPERSPSSPGAGSGGSDSAGGGWPGASGAGGGAPVAGPRRRGPGAGRPVPRRWGVRGVVGVVVWVLVVCAGVVGARAASRQAAS